MPCCPGRFARSARSADRGRVRRSYRSCSSPFPIVSAYVLSSHCSTQDKFGQCRAKHFRWSLGNHETPLIAPELFERQFGRQSNATVKLKASIRDAKSHFIAVYLHHERFSANIFACIEFGGGITDHQLGSVQFGETIRQYPLHALPLSQRLAKSLPLFGVIERHVETSLGNAAGACAVPDAALVEPALRCGKALSLFTDTIFGGDMNVVEYDLAGRIAHHGLMLC